MNKLISITRTLFCRHLFQEIKQESLEGETLILYEERSIDIERYDKYANHQRCIKCNKEQIKVAKKMIQKITVNESVTEAVTHWTKIEEKK